MASKYESEDEEEPPRGLLSSLKDLALKPFHLIFSRPALRTYITTFLLVSTAFILLGLAITAYILFYWNYIPRIGFERTIHLQFDNVYAPHANKEAHPYPYGTVKLSPDIVSAQRYDVVVELVLPRTPDNTRAGNFMLDVTMFAPEDFVSNIVDSVQAGLAPGETKESAKALAGSRRPAILQYRSGIVEMVYKLSQLHWYILNLREESEKLRVPMFEGVEFPKGWRNVPSTMKLEIQSTAPMQIYAAKAIFRARFRGLRWVMYNHRVISAVVFISSFWTTEMIFAGLTWVVFSAFMSPSRGIKDEEEPKRIKEEPEEESAAKMSETERTFPTSTSQRPLRYSSPSVKQEEDETIGVRPVTPAAEADDEDEDEDADFVVDDSGIGTSLDSSTSRRDNVRKRRGRLSLKEER